MKINVWSEEAVAVVVASDGVWEKLENKEVAKIVGKFVSERDSEQAGREIIAKTRKKWINVLYYFT